MSSQIQTAERKAKQGWKCYFTLLDRQLEVQTSAATRFSNTNRRLRNNEEVDITHLKAQFLEMYEKLNQLTSCPICLETMTKEQIHLPFCGHMICKSCKETGNVCVCPICRKKYA